MSYSRKETDALKKEKKRKLSLKINIELYMK